MCIANIVKIVVIVLQIASVIARNIFVYGNLLDSADLLLRFLKKPEIKYLIQFEESLYMPDNKVRKVFKAVIENIKNYLSEVMETKGPRTKLATQAFRTVVAACSGPNLVQDRTLTAASAALVSFFSLSLIICV